MLCGPWKVFHELCNMFCRDVLWIIAVLSIELVIWKNCTSPMVNGNGKCMMYGSYFMVHLWIITYVQWSIKARSMLHEHVPCVLWSIEHVLRSISLGPLGKDEVK